MVSRLFPPLIKGGQGGFTGKARHAQRGFLDMHEVADTDLPEEAGVVDDATALDAAVDLLDAYATACDASIVVYHVLTGGTVSGQG